VSSRRKGEHVPTAVRRRLGNRVLLAGIYLLFVAGVFLHGLVIWDNPFERAAALLAGAAMIAITVRMLRRGAFAPRVNLELRESESGAASFAVTAAGRPAVTDVRLEYAEREQRLRASGGEIPDFPSLRRIVFDAPPDVGDAARELKVWAHTVTPEHDSRALPADVDVRLGDESRQFDLELSRGQVVLPLTEASWSVEITLAKTR
jgi:hypothetical protein